ncbi:ABC transporter ATP-binding protein [Coleofasciculus sp.]|uniref:ABC transporter ATP-binding protein n=1 Tax=Coleofasciculus sp. TaxID=3100458 RepID=UPI0039F903DD
MSCIKIREKKVIKRLLLLLKIYPWAIPAIVTLGILSSVSEGLGVSLFIPFLQNLSQTSNPTVSDNALIGFLNQFLSTVPTSQRLVVIPLFIFGAIVLKNCLTYGNSVLLAWLNSRISHRLRSRIFDQLLSVSYSFLETKDSGKLLNTLATETWRTSEALGVLVNLIVSSCTTFVYVALLLLISWQLTLLVGGIMLLISLIIQFVTRQSKALGQKAVQVNAALGRRMYEGLAGMRTIRAFGREPYEQKQFDQASEQVRNIFMKLDTLSASVNPLYEVLSALLVLSIMVIALLQDRTALPTLLTFLFILYRLQPQMQLLGGNRVKLLMLASSVDDVMYFLEPSDKPYIRSGNLTFSGLQQAISLDSVSFRYNPHDKPALHNISISIPRGKTTAFVGPSGAGKSTLVNLICRFYEVTEGEIYVDNHPLKELDLLSWRRHLAIVSQDIYIFSNTVRENIAYGRLEATEAEVIAAAKQANAHEFIMQLPQGYETKVGDRGIRLSGGQRQRIALARAIIRNPEILILDEATNALDTISEHLIQEALNTFSHNRTVIVIAHRLSTIEKADQIIVMENGQVVELGNLQQLLQLNGLFAKLHRLQYHHSPA